MKLYYSPFACSLASHIACREAGLDVELRRAELSSKRIEGGDSLFSVNPLGQVPTLVTDDGRTLSELGAVLMYIADRAPEKQLAPVSDNFDRYELNRWLSFVATEIHKKGLWPIFATDTPDAVKDYARGAIRKPLEVVDAHLTAREVLVGEHFTVADAYLFWALTIAPYGKITLDVYPALSAFQQRHAARPAVQAALLYERDQRQHPFAA
jgi:glutathione S-transferase